MPPRKINQFASPQSSWSGGLAGNYNDIGNIQLYDQGSGNANPYPTGSTMFERWNSRPNRNWMGTGPMTGKFGGGTPPPQMAGTGMFQQPFHAPNAQEQAQNGAAIQSQLAPFQPGQGPQLNPQAHQMGGSPWQGLPQEQAVSPQQMQGQVQPFDAQKAQWGPEWNPQWKTLDQQQGGLVPMATPGAQRPQDDGLMPGNPRIPGATRPFGGPTGANPHSPMMGHPAGNTNFNIDPQFLGQAGETPPQMGSWADHRINQLLGGNRPFTPGDQSPPQTPPSGEPFGPQPRTMGMFNRQADANVYGHEQGLIARRQNDPLDANGRAQGLAGSGYGSNVTGGPTGTDALIARQRALQNPMAARAALPGSPQNNMQDRFAPASGEGGLLTDVRSPGTPMNPQKNVYSEDQQAGMDLAKKRMFEVAASNRQLAQQRQVNASMQAQGAGGLAPSPERAKYEGIDPPGPRGPAMNTSPVGLNVPPVGQANGSIAMDQFRRGKAAYQQGNFNRNPNATGSMANLNRENAIRVNNTPAGLMMNAAQQHAAQSDQAFQHWQAGRQMGSQMPWMQEGTPNPYPALGGMVQGMGQQAYHQQQIGMMGRHYDQLSANQQQGLQQQQFQNDQIAASGRYANDNSKTVDEHLADIQRGRQGGLVPGAPQPPAGINPKHLERDYPGHDKMANFAGAISGMTDDQAKAAMLKAGITPEHIQQYLESGGGSGRGYKTRPDGYPSNGMFGTSIPNPLWFLGGETASEGNSRRRNMKRLRGLVH